MFIDVSTTDLAVCGVRLSGKLECWDLYNTGFWRKYSPTDPLAYPSTDITDTPPGEFRDVELERHLRRAARRRTSLLGPRHLDRRNRIVPSHKSPTGEICACGSRRNPSVRGEHSRQDPEAEHPSRCDIL